ncbi:MAG TPA: DUF4056 domain-containing protein [Draconibacterium sp.]|nr:DUF4056 domain-containing protein [Draconibacterium sp.]
MIQFFNSRFQSILTVTFLFAMFYVNAKAPVITSKELSIAPARIIRTCCGFGVEIGIAGVPFAKKTDITSREIMGTHSYMGGRTEQNGIIYTRRGGFLDMGHLRDCADWTAYLYNLIKASQTDSYYRHIELRNEGGAKSLDLNVPADLSEEDIISLAGKISFDLSMWHEISTWFGASYVPLIPEKFSSFSPEDMYSNLMGVHLGMRAIKNKLEYDTAMTIELSDMLDSLESVNTEAETYNAMLKVNEVWYTNQKKYPNKNVVLKRYIEFGPELIPWLVPGYESRLQPYVLQKPADSLSKYYRLSLKLNFRFPVDSVIPDKEDRIITQNDFDKFVHFIQTEINREEILTEEKQLNKEEKLNLKTEKRKEKTESRINR